VVAPASNEATGEQIVMVLLMMRVLEGPAWQQAGEEGPEDYYVLGNILQLSICNVM